MRWSGLATVIMVLIAGLFTVAAVGSLVVGAINLANGNEPGGGCPFAGANVSVNIWLVVYGAVSVVMIIWMLISYCVRTASYGVNMFLGFVWGLMYLFIAYPWAVVGTVLLLDADCSFNGATFGWSVFALVMAYVLAAIAAMYTSWYMYELNFHKANKIEPKES